MQSWKQLSAGLIDRLVTEVQQMQVLGARQRVSAVLKEDGLLVDGDGNLIQLDIGRGDSVSDLSKFSGIHAVVGTL